MTIFYHPNKKVGFLRLDNVNSRRNLSHFVSYLLRFITYVTQIKCQNMLYISAFNGLHRSSSMAFSDTPRTPSSIEKPLYKGFFSAYSTMCITQYIKIVVESV